MFHFNRTTRIFAPVARKLLLGISLVIVCQCALAQAMYRIKPVSDVPGGCGALYGSAFNNSGWVAGSGACNANGSSHAFLWKNDGRPAIDLGPPEAGSYSEGAFLSASGLVSGYAADSTGEFVFVSSGDPASMVRIYNTLGGSDINVTGMNDLGQVTGYASNADNILRAFIWKNDGSPMQDLGTLGGDSADGAAINASGQVVGEAQLANGSWRAFVWKNDGTPMLNLGTLRGYGSGACCINASGQVAGASRTPRGFVHAFFWRNDGTPMQDLGSLGGPYVTAVALNDAGQIAGYAYTHKPGSSNEHAFVWLNDGTPMMDLGTLGGTESAAWDMNSSGQVTGKAYLADSTPHAFLWRNDGTSMEDLNKLIDPTDPLEPYITLSLGTSINEYGDILAYGTDSRTGDQSLYVLQGTVLTLTPRSLAFGNQPIHTTSAAKSVTVTNTSPKAVAVTSIALTGSALGQFAFTSNCSKSLAGHATCTIKVAFKPTTKGAKSAALTVNGGGGGLRSVKLTGTGT